MGEHAVAEGLQHVPVHEDRHLHAGGDGATSGGAGATGLGATSGGAGEPTVTMQNAVMFQSGVNRAYVALARTCSSLRKACTFLHPEDSCLLQESTE